MPEGDVVWRTADRLHAALAGRELSVADLRWPTLATHDLTGRDVLEVVAAGKHLLTRLAARPGSASAGPLTLHSHLRMDGSWYVQRTGQTTTSAGRAGRQGTGSRYRSGGSAAGRAEHTIRAVLGNQTWSAVGYRLGELDLVPTADEHTLVGHLGPDVLGSTWDPAEVQRRLLADPQRPIGEALLDQRVLAGVGTFFMCEALFLRGVTPWSPTVEAGDLPALVDLIHRLLYANRDRSVQATTGDLRRGRHQWVHSRSGWPCRRCASTIRVAAIGRAPTDRTASYCPTCQRGPVPHLE